MAAQGGMPLAAPLLILCVRVHPFSDAVSPPDNEEGRTTISNAEFDALGRQGYNRIPLACVTFADLDTPLSLYLKLANRPYSYLLESVQGGERFGRYSFIGLPADTRSRCAANRSH